MAFPTTDSKHVPFRPTGNDCVPVNESKYPLTQPSKAQSELDHLKHQVRLLQTHVEQLQFDLDTVMLRQVAEKRAAAAEPTEPVAGIASFLKLWIQIQSQLKAIRLLSNAVHVCKKGRPRHHQAIIIHNAGLLRKRAVVSELIASFNSKANVLAADLNDELVGATCQAICDDL